MITFGDSSDKPICGDPVEKRGFKRVTWQQSRNWSNVAHSPAKDMPGAIESRRGRREPSLEPVSAATSLDFWAMQVSLTMLSCVKRAPFLSCFQECQLCDGYPHA